MPVVLPAAQEAAIAPKTGADDPHAVRITPDGVGFAATDNAVPTGGPQYSGFVPDPSSYPTGSVAAPKLDAERQLCVRGPVITDERSFRTDFAAVSTTLTGTISVANGATTMTGTETLFRAEVTAGDYVRASAHGESVAALVEEVVSDTEITLAAAYAGATVSGVSGVVAEFKTTTPAGGTITMSSVATLTAPTTSGATVAIYRAGDYSPFVLTVYCKVSQRIANQDVVIGFQDLPGSPT